VHSIELDGASLDYRLCRSARRTIGITVDRYGIRVGAPLSASLAEIETLLRRHGDWVLQKLAQWRASQIPVATLEDGDRIHWLGKPLVLRCVTDRARSRLRADAGILELCVPVGHALPTTLTAFLKPRARAFFLERLIHYAGKLEVATPPLVLSSAKSRWGSCNAKGEIRLSWRLIHFAPNLIDYVVAHELAHLKEMNHGPRFWAVVEKLCPDWRHARAELRRQAHTLPGLE
jgi:predicted metal-dependent hydrolase